MPVYDIFNSQGQRINRIQATPEFVEQHYPNRYVLVSDDPPTPGPSIEAVRESKLAEMNRAFEALAAQLTEGYPPGEQLTWEVQRQEALAWQADDAAPTPFLDQMAAARGIDPAEMRQKTLAQALLFLAHSAVLVGTRQNRRDAVLAAETIEELNAVTWEPVDADPS